jgi:glycosyltransferase involved in cell wall biosynthesis
MIIGRSYTISHIHLEQKQELYLQIKEDAKYYWLFWWRHIPLGHLFIEPHEKMDRDALQLKILGAIQSCIEYYISTYRRFKHNYQTYFLQYDHKGFSMAMETIFSSYRVNAVPEKVDVSVIICTRNRSRVLSRCLHSLLNQIYPPQEIIVIDNAPSDESTRLLIEQFKVATYVKEPKPGLSIARNTGIRLASASVVAFTDDDVILDPLWTYRVWQTFLSPEVCSMTGLIIASSLETESQQIFEKFWGFNKGYQDKIFDHSFIDRNLKKAPPVWVIGAGANMAFRKSLFDTIGYFDERLGAGAAGCSEDSELWFRILSGGFYVHYNPRAVVHHEHRKEISALRKQMYWYTRGHVAAALIQHKQYTEAGYNRRVFIEYPFFYIRRLIKGFPTYRFKDRTLFNEILGWCSGVLFFLRNRTKTPKVGASVPTAAFNC